MKNVTRGGVGWGFKIKGIAINFDDFVVSRVMFNKLNVDNLNFTVFGIENEVTYLSYRNAVNIGKTMDGVWVLGWPEFRGSSLKVSGIRNQMNAILESIGFRIILQISAQQFLPPSDSESYGCTKRQVFY